jgi:hypothetical protein
MRGEPDQCDHRAQGKMLPKRCHTAGKPRTANPASQLIVAPFAINPATAVRRRTKHPKAPGVEFIAGFPPDSADGLS